MPVHIGGKPQSGFDDPIGLLGDCHRRVETYLAVLVRVATEARGTLLSEDQRLNWNRALRYFREAAPKHTADEEESLFPRLRGVVTPEVEAVLARMRSLELDHRRAGPAHDEVERLGQLWLENGVLPTAEAERLCTVLEELAELYRAHILIEDSEVFPVAAAHLTSSDRKAIGAEMAARRGLAVP